MKAQLIVTLSVGSAPSVEAEFSRAEAELQRQSAEAERAARFETMVETLRSVLADAEKIKSEFGSLGLSVSELGETLDEIIDGEEAQTDGKKPGEADANGAGEASEGGT